MFWFSRNKTKQLTGSQLAEEGLRQVSIAIKNNKIDLHRGQICNDIYVHQDDANGFPRCTYVMLSPTERNDVIARCVILLDRTHGPMPIWQIDYAVARNYRKKGFGLAIAAKAMAEFTAGMANQFEHGYAVEALVDEGNEPSVKIAKAILGGEKLLLNKKTSKKYYSFLRQFR